MDLRRRLASWALSRPQVLLVDAQGSRELRWRVEAELDRRRWPVALSPADADLLLVLGEPGPRLAAAVDVLWSQVPGPRFRQDMRSSEDLEAQLDSAHALLLQVPEDASHEDPEILLHGQGEAPSQDAEHQSGHAEYTGGSGHDERAASGHDDRGGDGNHATPGEHGRAGMEGHGDHAGDRGDHRHADDHTPSEPAHQEHLAHEHAEHDNDEHAGHGDHHMHHGGVVAGLAMASTAPDRDGLELDALSVSLGPVLPGWPTGMVVSGLLLGDVLTAADASWLDDRPASPSDGSMSAALDSLAQFLLVAGWPTAARRARAARDDLRSADETVVARGRSRAAALARTVRRSRTLRWSVRGIGTTADGTDVLDRVLRWCDAATGSHADPYAVSIEELPGLVEGQELAAVRLTVASVDLAAAPAHAHHGMHHA